jgi:hypothetical protein
VHAAATRFTRQRRDPRWFSSALALVVIFWSAASLGQSDADRATARALAAEGFKALQTGNYETAEDRFRRADALVHAPTLVLDRGRALMGMGRYVEAQEQFELVLREGVPPKAPRSWKAAVQEAATLLEEVEPKVAWLTIAVPDVAEPEIRVDGQPIPPAALGVRRATNPGTRTIDVGAAGYAPRRLTIELTEGGEESLEVALEPLPKDAPAPRPPRSKPSPEADAPPRDLAPYVAFGVGGLGIIVGSVTGALTIKKHSELSDACPGGVCPEEERETLDSYHRLGWVSGVGFAVGAAGAATGVVLLVRQKRESSTETAARSRLELFAGPGRAGLRGTFR